MGKKRKTQKSCPFDMEMPRGGRNMMAPARDTIRDTTQLMMGAATLELGFGALGMIGGLVKKP
jgi:hypothetical protein